MRFEDLSEELPDFKVPPLDRKWVGSLDREQRQWRENGYVILKDFIPQDLIDRYVEVRSAHGEYPTPTPYMDIPEIRDLCLHAPLMDKLKNLIGDDMGLHLNLTGWTSTERNWHQDDYLNPPYINGWYCAVWFALDTIHPDSGPFEYIPKSHKWPLLRRDKVLSVHQDGLINDPAWPKITEPTVARAMDDKILEKGLENRFFLANKGDVLIWHPRLAHRGTAPRDSSLERRAIISHYSALSKRQDMPRRQQHTSGGWYFVL